MADAAQESEMERTVKTLVPIWPDIYAEFEQLAKRTRTTPEIAINSALNAWLGRM